MNIISHSTNYTYPILITLSVVCLYRGHNLPGGGFIGGLLAASAVMLYALCNGWSAALNKLRIAPDTLLGMGILLACFSGLFGVMVGESFMTAQWLPTFSLPLLGVVKLGTPILFDVGVYLTVIGFTIKCAEALGTYNTPHK